MVQWSDSFWGEGNRGFEILSSNVKNGAIAIEEFHRFLIESAQCESTYSKNLSRIQTQFLKGQNVGTFTPIWNLIRDLLDKISSTHLTTVNFYQDLLRDIHNYHDLYQKKIKMQIQKDGDISRTTDLITQLNNALNNVNKAKEQYHSIALEYERTKRTGSNPTSTSTSQENNSTSLAQSALNSISFRQTDRLEKKYRQAQEDYKLCIEKYNTIRSDYEKRFTDASMKFQDFEIDHIEKMLAFSLNYSDVLQRTNDQIRLAQNSFNEKLKLLTGNELLDAFVEQKKTGTDRPAALQFEEVDNLKTSIHLSDLPSTQDDYNLTNQFESGVPSFQAHFSVQSPPVKHHDNNRARHHHHLFFHGTHSPSNDPTSSPISLTSVPSSPMSTNSMMTRSQEGNNNGNDQTPNPFDVKIKRTKFPGFFGTNRKDKDKKDKKNEKKLPPNVKPHRNLLKRNSRDDPNGNNLQNSNYESNDTMVNTDNNDDYVRISLNNKPKSLTPEPSSPSISNDESTRRIQFPSSKNSKSSSSSDSSDDDDNLMTKIFVKINQPKSQPASDEDGETKIMNAMRLVDKNLGNFAVNTRGLSNKTSDMNKSISSGQIGTRMLPPPPPIVSRSTLTIQKSMPTNNVDHSNMFPPHEDFAQFPSNTTNQENLSIPSQSTSGSKNTTSISSNDDDSEVANSFPTNDSINKRSPFPILQVPSLFQLNQQRSLTLSNSSSPSFGSVNQNFNNSPININEQGTSPLTVGGIDQIPLAIAFQETIHVMISGDNQENWKSRIAGQMLISFPSSILNLFMDTSRATNTLEFRLKHFDNIENITAKPSLITQNEGLTDSEELNYSFDMTELNNTLQNLQEKNPSSPFFNLNVLNYELKQSNIPIEISSQWTRTIDTISVNIKYHFNSSIIPESIRFNNNVVIIYTIITDGQQIKQSSPNAEWSANDHKLWWKVPYINNGTGNLTATINTMQTDIDENDNNENPLTTSSTVKVHFIGENALFSSIDFDLTSRGYRISLLKKKILSGKYQSEPDQSEPIQLFKRSTTDT